MKKQKVLIALKDFIKSFVIIELASATCMLLHKIDHTSTYLSMIFILAVFLVSRFTNGYVYGIIASLVSIVIFNYFFTYPYYSINVTLAGYPITIICMLAVSIITSAMTTQIKTHHIVLLEAEMEKRRSNLLRALSHDLRTPLTSILGASSAIMDNDKNLDRADRLKLLSEIYDDAQWLIRMVENLLSITRIDSDRAAEIVKVDVAVEELVPEAVMKFQKRFPEQYVSVKVPSYLFMVPMDAMLIEQVLINLLENAVLHAKNMTAIHLEVRDEHGMAVFEVSDDGEGIKSDILPRIFKGYNKIDEDRTCDSKKNMGIGLSVCNTIVKAHNGTMAAANKPEGGALFTFCLPLEEQ